MVAKSFAWALALATAALMAVQTVPAHAHDIWLQADRFVVSEGDTLVVRQWVGAELEAHASSSEETTELPLLLDMTTRFELITGEGSVDLLGEARGGRAGQTGTPVLSRRVDSPGPALVVMDHDVLYTAHTDSEFLHYLEHESLDPAAYRPQMGTDGLQDEGYVRTLKALVQVGGEAAGGPSGLHDRATGQALELVLLEDPYSLDPGAELSVRLLLHGEPLVGTPVKALSAVGGSVTARAARTDAEGTATFVLDRPGLWLVRAVHLARCSEQSSVDCSDTEWESYWTAFAFELD